MLEAMRSLTHSCFFYTFSLCSIIAFALCCMLVVGVKRDPAVWEPYALPPFIARTPFKPKKIFPPTKEAEIERRTQHNSQTL